MRLSVYAALALIAAAVCPLSAQAQVAQEPNYQLVYSLNLLTIPECTILLIQKNQLAGIRRSGRSPRIV